MAQGGCSLYLHLCPRNINISFVQMKSADLLLFSVWTRWEVNLRVVCQDCILKTWKRRNKRCLLLTLTTNSSNNQDNVSMTHWRKKMWSQWGDVFRNLTMHATWIYQNKFQQMPLCCAQSSSSTCTCTSHAVTQRFCQNLFPGTFRICREWSSRTKVWLYWSSLVLS